jgi:predicted ArsR family transcriptional regulator
LNIGYDTYLTHVIPVSRDKSMRVDETDQRILTYLNKQDWPVTTEMVAKELHVSWNTAQVHLYKLLAERLVNGRRVGRQNQWIITDEGRKGLRR